MADFKMVKKYIDELDFMCLLRFPCCAPDDEYNGVSRKIAETVNDKMNADEAAEIIAETFSKSFGEGCKASDFYTTAEKILGLTEKHLCPVCRKHCFSEQGSYEICPVCRWEDDPVQGKDHCFYGGANSLSVNESQLYYYLKDGAASEKLAQLEGEYADDPKRFAAGMIRLYCETTGEDEELVRLDVYGRKMS